MFEYPRLFQSPAEYHELLPLPMPPNPWPAGSIGQPPSMNARSGALLLIVVLVSKTGTQISTPAVELPPLIGVPVVEPVSTTGSIVSRYMKRPSLLMK